LATGVAMPDEKVPQLRDGYNQKQIETLDLEAAGS
jgi:hypothetical protein